MAAFYKHDIASWMDGTEGLSDGAYRLFHVVCQLIYLHEGPVTLNERGLAGRCNQSTRALRRNLDELISAGKLTIENGKLANFRTEKELENLRTNRENARKGGEASGKSRNHTANPLKNNDPSEATLQDDRSLKDKTREEKTREESPLEPPQGEARKRAKPRRPFPEDFWPDATGVAKAREAGMTEDDVRREVAAMIDRARAKGEVYADHQAAWRTWVGNWTRFGRRRTTGPPGPALALVYRDN